MANNAPKPGSKGLGQLRYADDDGARFYELFSLMAERTILLSVLDPETQVLHPVAARASKPPTRRELLLSLAETFEVVRRAKSSGRRTELFFVFVGHGSASPSGEGIMHLLDGGFSRSDLFQEVVAKSPADLNHVIVDACNAFLFVGGRGETNRDARIDRAVDQFLARERMAKHPNTGFVLSTSAAEEVHEWSGFQAGVFSHEVRSALLGGADVDGNGRITYDEVRAFIQAANGKVKNPKAKLDPWVAPPSIFNQAPLFDRAWVTAPVTSVHLGRELAGRWSLEDDRGVRIADIHSAQDGPVTLLLPTPRAHWLRRGGEEIRIEAGAGVAGALDASNLVLQPAEQRPRSGPVESFRQNLFAIPFGLAFLEGYRLAHSRTLPLVSLPLETEPLPPNRTVQHWTGGTLIALGLGAVATGLIIGEMANQSAESYRRAVGRPDDVSGFRSEARDRETVANILLGGGSALALGGLVVVLW